MLKHEENSETPSQSAARKRVTSAELASAIARLESKQEGEADGTIGIGEAVSELGLAATPEAVWAEVEAVRAQRAKADKRQGKYIALLILLSSLGLGGFIGSRITRTTPPKRPSPPAVAVALSPPQALPKPISLDPNLLVKTTSNKLVTLSEVGDNQPVGCFYNEDDRSFQPYSPDEASTRESWTLIKHGGQVYVRGWIPHISAQALQKYGVTVGTWESDYKDVDPSLVPLTLPVNGFQVGAGGDRDREFHAVNLHLDKYAYEKWNP